MYNPDFLSFLQIVYHLVSLIYLSPLITKPVRWGSQLSQGSYRGRSGDTLRTNNQSPAHSSTKAIACWWTWEATLKEETFFTEAWAIHHPTCFVGSGGSRSFWGGRKTSLVLKHQPAKPRVHPFSTGSCLNEVLLWCQQQRVSRIGRQSQQPNSTLLEDDSSYQHHAVPHTYPSVSGNRAHKSLASRGELPCLKSWICHLFVQYVWKQLL